MDCKPSITTNIDEVINDENSNDNSLTIVVESPESKKTKKSKTVQLSHDEKEFIKKVEDELDHILDEKASKTNLTATNVKTILKQVLTNEDMQVLLRKAENPNNALESVTFEPKLTRAKAKELHSSNSIATLPWPPSTSTSPEVHVLINDELPEDSSDDEYVPGDYDSEDDRDSSLVSESPRCSTPPTPSKNDCGTQTNWTEDGVFKVPPSKKDSTEETTNIALRTRSKFCLSETPLEIIEEAFVPPDITTDMYDMDCDDEEWGNFLKEFMRPLEEVTKAREDEDHDPEYNVLADEIDRVDREDLRADRGVKVTKKELNELISELFEYAESFSTSQLENVSVNFENEPQYKVLDETLGATKSPDRQKGIEIIKKTTNLNTVEEKPQVQINDTSHEINISNCETQILMTAQYMDYGQLLLLQQQMRQHVQMLTQNFLLTYQHPEFCEMAVDFKEKLLNLKYLSKSHPNSNFNAANLEAAIELISDWEKKFVKDCEEGRQIVRHFSRVIQESIDRRRGTSVYIYTFPPSILETISKSKVFIYPSLLPCIPFKSSAFTFAKHDYTKHENELIALGLEQFCDYLKSDSHHIHKDGEVKLNHVCHFIVRYMMPVKNVNRLCQHIKHNKSKNAAPNPILYYFENGKAPPTFHYVFNLETYGMLAPFQRNKETLSYQWRTFLYPKEKESGISLPKQLSPLAGTIKKIVKPPAFKRFVTKGFSKPKILKSPISSVPYTTLRSLHRKAGKDKNVFYEGIKLASQSTPKSRLFSRICKQKNKGANVFSSKNIKELIGPSLAKLKFNSSIFQSLKNKSNALEMLPNMPSLNTPIKKPLTENMEITINSSIGKTDEVNITVNEKGRDGCSTDQKSSEQFKKGKLPLNMSSLNGSISNCMEITSTNNSTKQLDVEDNEKKRSIESDGTSSQEEDCITIEDDTMEKDNPDDINALMVASSTIKCARRKERPGTERKRAKLKREYNAMLAMLKPEDNCVIQERAETYAYAYFDKVRKTLNHDEYHQFMKILNDFDEKYDKVSDLYQNIEHLLHPKYQDLLDEFLTFLTPTQASEIGKLIPHLMLSNMSLFLCKLEAYFKDQPAQLRKVYRCLTELASCVDVTIDKVKNTILPLLKGNSLLTDWFMQIFPSEKPPESLLQGPFENIDLSVDIKNENEIYENITLPDSEDPYGGPKCICKCHESENILYKTRSRHCIPCGTKFIQGRIYIQTGKGLRLANVTFDGKSGPEHNIKLYVEKQKKRSDSSLSKQISPTKESQDDGRTHADSEDDDRKKTNQRTNRSPRKRKPKNTDAKGVDKEKTSTKTSSGNGRNGCGKVCRQKGASTQSSPGTNIKIATNSTGNLTVTTVRSSNSDKRSLNDDPTNYEANMPVESAELKMNSEHSTESESDVPESSQYNTNSETDESGEEAENMTTSPSHSDKNSDDIIWTLDEDRIILETLQKEIDKDKAFEKIAESLENRTVFQIRQRFHTLMELLQQMTETK
ncbi:uncharacterized protein LOC108742578 [Agrilus planipennis]|uniref:Uncharacterized protein LOC108742578 n=1 Tax=Agrilus planipennis TaxID=224129 RepID=A0A1W4XB65_AGRPL|nr:uncharacterized protein LOC108742578 [Agrilus planipennis]